MQKRNRTLNIFVMATLSRILPFIAGAMLFIAPCSVLASPRGKRVVRPAVEQTVPDSLRSFYAYTDALKHLVIRGDSTASERGAVAALEADSANMPARALLARLQMRNNAAAAYANAQRVYAADTADLHNLELLAVASVRAGDLDRAVEAYTALTRRTTNPDHFRILAILYESRQRHYAALAVLDTAEMRMGREPFFSQFRQRLYIATNQMAKAEAEAALLVGEMPYRAENHIALADIRAAMGRDSLAEAGYRRAIALDSTAVGPRAALADFYRKGQRTTEYLDVLGWLFDSEAVPLAAKTAQFGALTSNIRFYRDNYFRINMLAQKLAIHYPDNREVADLYTKHLVASGEVAEAAGVMKRFLDDRHSPTAEDFERVIELEGYLEHYDSVDVYLGRALQRFPDNVEMHARRGHVRLVRKDFEGAVEAYRAAMRYARTDGERSTLWGSTGDAEHNAGDMKACYKAYEKALRYNPDNNLVLDNYAYFIATEEAPSQERLERALQMAERACKLSAANPTYLDTLAWVLFKLGRAAEAKPFMQQALSLDRNSSSELALHYGDILHALGEEFMARTYWRRALERGADAAEIERRITPPQTSETTVEK